MKKKDLLQKIVRLLRIAARIVELLLETIKFLE
jgi:hypothetical protein